MIVVERGRKWKMRSRHSARLAGGRRQRAGSNMRVESIVGSKRGNRSRAPRFTDSRPQHPTATTPVTRAVIESISHSSSAHCDACQPCSIANLRTASHDSGCWQMVPGCAQQRRSLSYRSIVLQRSETDAIRPPPRHPEFATGRFQLGRAWRTPASCTSCHQPGRQPPIAHCQRLAGSP
jgi:hypothetical protein